MSGAASSSSSDKDKGVLNAGVAGVVRGTLRSTMRSMAPRLARYRPKLRPPRVPVKEGTAMFHGVLEAAHHQAVHSAPEHENGYLRKRIVAQAPGLARTAVLGFTLWTAYDIAIEHLSERQTHKSLGSTVWISMVAGGSAGTLHGVLTGATDKFFFPQLAVDRPSRLAGVAFSHGLSHMAMFATYQSIRAYLVDNREWHPMAGIVAAGAVSGVAVDVVSHLTAPFEHVAFADACRHFKYVKLPPASEMAISAGATVVGWVAFERAKEMHNN